MDRSIESPQIFLETNILGTQNLLDNAKKAWIVSKDENSYPVYREGDNLRDWIFVEDNYKGIDLILRNTKVGEVYNIDGFNEEKT